MAIFLCCIVLLFYHLHRFDFPQLDVMQACKSTEAECNDDTERAAAQAVKRTAIHLTSVVANMAGHGSHRYPAEVEQTLRAAGVNPASGKPRGASTCPCCRAKI